VESADGTAIYYDVHGTIMKAGLDGSNEAKLVDGATAGAQNFAIAKEGVFYRPREMSGEIWFMSFVDGKTRRILKPDKPLASGMSVSPDGHWLLSTRKWTGNPGTI
jgi:hypothetical protein